MLWKEAEARTQPAAATTQPTPVGTTAPWAHPAAPEATPAVDPTPAPALPVRRAPTSPRHQGALADRFLEGYRHAGGPPALEAHLVNDVIPCESSWQLDPPGPHCGLAQFECGDDRVSGTWAAARCSSQADYRDPWEQGCAVATWINAGVDPGGTGGWPTCWWAGP